MTENTSPTPICLAMITCDRVYIEPITRKEYLLGVTNHFVLPYVPCRIAELDVFCSLTEMRGEYHPYMRIEHETTREVVFEMETREPITVEDPLKIHDVTFRVQGLTIRTFGSYWLSLFANGTLIKQRLLSFRQMSPKE